MFSLHRTIRVQAMVHREAYALVSRRFAACVATPAICRMRSLQQRKPGMDPKRIDELARRLAAVLPEGINDLRTDMERNFRAVLQGTLARMDVVTREEFDVQAGVLARTREKVEQLLQRLEELEKALAKSSGGTRGAGKKTGGTGAARKKKRPESPG
jgi:hypothetical protein